MHNEKDGVPITAIREIKILKQLHHKNIVPLADIAVQKGDLSFFFLSFYQSSELLYLLSNIAGNRTRKERTSIYMVFPYMDHDLAGLLENPSVKLSVPQIKTYLKQLLEGTSYLHHVCLRVVFLRSSHAVLLIITYCRTKFYIVI
jgi:serine/threonine protein kinase